MVGFTPRTGGRSLARRYQVKKKRPTLTAWVPFRAEKNKRNLTSSPPRYKETTDRNSSDNAEVTESNLRCYAQKSCLPAPPFHVMEKNPKKASTRGRPPRPWATAIFAPHEAGRHSPPASRTKVHHYPMRDHTSSKIHCSL